MAKPKKKRSKKYHPKPCRINATIAGRLIGEKDPLEFEILKEFAEESLDRIQLGSENGDDYANAYCLVRNLWVLATQFEEKADLQLLCIMAKAALCFLIDHPKFTPRAPVCAPVQHAFDAYFELARQFDRAALIASQRVASDQYKTLIRARKDSFCFLNPSAPPNDVVHGVCKVRSIAYIRGECVTGYLEIINGRYVWRNPLNGSSLVLEEPTLIFLVYEHSDKIEETFTKGRLF